MNTAIIAGVLLLVFFSESPLLLRSAGLDSAGRFSDSPRHVAAFSAVIASSAIISDLLSYVALSVLLPRLGAAPSTLLDGVVIVLSVLLTAAVSELLIGSFLPKLKVIFGEDLFSVAYNSATAGIVLLCRAFADGLRENIIYCLLISAAVALSYYVLSCLREDLALYRIPKAFRGAPILLILLGLAALAFMGYVGAAIPEFDPIDPML